MKYSAFAVQAVNIGLWAVFLLAYVLAFLANWDAASPRFISYTVFCSTLGAVLCGGLWRLLIARAVRRAEEIDLSAVAGLLGTAFLAALVHAVISTISEPMFFKRPLGSFGQMVMANFISFCFIYCLVYCFGLVMEMARRDAARRESLILAEARAHQAHLLALRLQINPHFLFNALNAVASLVTMQRDPEALTTIHRLSRFLRLVTETSPNAFSPLPDELEMAEEYLAVEAIRFQDRMRVEIDAKPETDTVKVPNFILQPLIENAVKHGVGATVQPTLIAISALLEGAVAKITVENSSDDPAVADYRPDGMGVGLKNVEERLRALYADAATMTAARTARGFRVVLTLPAAGPARGNGE